MSADLVKRADAMRAFYKTRESVPGSGYHDGDRNPNRPDVFMAPQKNGLPHASSSVVAYTDSEDEIVYFVGDDASRVMASLQAWMDKHKNVDVVSMPGTDRKLMLKIIPKLALSDSAGTPCLKVWLCDWNDVLAALNQENVGILGAPFVDDGSTPS